MKDITNNYGNLPSSQESLQAITLNFFQEALNHNKSLAPTNNLLGAADDFQAINQWLSEFTHSPHTYRAYEKESLRFLYWVYQKHGVSLGNIRKNHIHDYRHFLQNPQPAEYWCCPPSERKKSRQQRWRPFSGPLKVRSIQTAMTILKSMFDYLINARYLDSNPFVLIKQRLTQKFDMEEQRLDLSERLLTEEDFDLLHQALDSMLLSKTKEPIWVARTRFILDFLGYMGLRVSELVQVQGRHFIYQSGSRWLVVTGKGQKTARVPVSDHCWNALQTYLLQAGLPTEPPLDAYLLCRFDKSYHPSQKLSLTERAVHLICKECAHEAAALTTNHYTKEKMQRFSPHWLRHFSASIQAKNDIPFEFIKAHHRHAKDETTRLYIHHEDQLRHEWSQKIVLRNQRGPKK